MGSQYVVLEFSISNREERPVLPYPVAHRATLSVLTHRDPRLPVRHFSRLLETLLHPVDLGNQSFSLWHDIHFQDCRALLLRPPRWRCQQSLRSEVRGRVHTAYSMYRLNVLSSLVCTMCMGGACGPPHTWGSGCPPPAFYKALGMKQGQQAYTARVRTQ